MTLLSRSFLDTYTSHPGLPSLLSNAVWGSKLYRDEDKNWLGCVRRVVEANCSLDPNVSTDEAEKLFHYIYTTKILPSGRGLWTAGVPGMPPDASQNCYACEINGIEDIVWGMNMLMCGGGVGFSTLHVDKIGNVSNGWGCNPRISILCRKDHPDIAKFSTESEGYGPSYDIEDTRQAWAGALEQCLRAAYSGMPITFDVSKIRQEGAPLRTFGGTASGPAPLVNLLRKAYYIVRSYSGRKLTQEAWKDLTCLVGVCVVAGSARRSAILTLGSADNQAFYYDKNDTEKLNAFRFASNNSIAITTPRDLAHLDYSEIATSMLFRGDPGIINMMNIWKTDSGVICLNPCGEATLHNYESCCLGEWFPSKCASTEEREKTLELITRFTLRQRLLPMSHTKAEEIRQKNMRIGVGISGIAELSWDVYTYARYYNLVRFSSTYYANKLGVAAPITCTVVKPSGTVSLLAGVTPGIHADFAPYYIRRIRSRKNAMIAQSLLAAGVPAQSCVYDPTGSTLAFEFPVKSNATVFESNESLEVQFKRLRTVQEGWADQSVSCTLKASPDEAEELADLLRANVPHLKAISCLARDATQYAQPPYEAITEKEYHARKQDIMEDYPLVYGGSLEYDECAGGACPIN